MKTGIYKHYKGGLYLVLGFATQEETLEPAVIYQHLSNDYGTWIRDQKVFEEILSLENPLYQGPRFQFVRSWKKEDTIEHPLALPLLEKS